jgi:transposase
MITVLIMIGIFWMVNFKTRNCHTNVKILLKMPSISRYNKVKVVTRAQYGLSHAQISIDLEIPRSTVSAMLRKWRQTGTVEKRPGSGRHPMSIGDQDEALLNVIRDSPFTTTVNTANISLFPSSIRTARRGK